MLKWTEYDGTSKTLPPDDDKKKILLHASWMRERPVVRESAQARALLLDTREGEIAKWLPIPTEAQLTALAEALEFYADPKKHKLKGEWQHNYPGGIVYAVGVDAFCDTGQIAKAALAKLKEVE